MGVGSLFIYLKIFLMAVVVRGQSDFMCPPNRQMGLCDTVATPCYGDSDCLNGEICCPHACSRVCKPRANSQHTLSSARREDIPDLLNDPRVYIGQCPDASCFALFGGGPNECSTSNVCPSSQYCCYDGCKNVCHLKPEYAALAAQQEAKQRYQQQVMLQKQQEEMRRRQNELYQQQQRQMMAAEQARQQAQARAAADAELAAQQSRLQAQAQARAAAEAELAAKQARQQAQARAAAEAELAAQQNRLQAQARAAAEAELAAQARASYEADQKAKAEAEAKAAAKRQRDMAQSQAQALLQEQQRSQPTPPPTPSQPSFLDNFVETPQNPPASAKPGNIYSQPKWPYTDTGAAAPQGAGSDGPGGVVKSLNSPANYNPYSMPPQQNTYNKNDEVISILLNQRPYPQPSYPNAPSTSYNPQPSYPNAPSTSYNPQPSYPNAPSTSYNPQLNYPNAPSTSYNPQPNYPNAPSTSYNPQPSYPNAPSNNYDAPGYYQNAPSVVQNVPTTPQNFGPRPQSAVAPLLMYHLMQAVA